MAPANAEPGEIPAPGRVIRTAEAARITGLAMNTVRRRVAAWQRGDRSDYALRGWAPADGGDRYIDLDDTHALAAQMRGELPPGRHHQATEALACGVDECRTAPVEHPSRLVALGVAAYLGWRVPGAGEGDEVLRCPTHR